MWSIINALSYLILHYSYFMNDVWSSNKFLKVRQLKSGRIVIQLKPNFSSIKAKPVWLKRQVLDHYNIDIVLWILFSAVTILLFTVLQFTAIISLLHHILLSLFFFFSLTPVPDAIFSFFLTGHNKQPVVLNNLDFSGLWIKTPSREILFSALGLIPIY